jgi:putative PEP-CTERM system histidine kinase
MLIYDSRLLGPDDRIVETFAFGLGGDAGLPLEAVLYAIGAIAFSALAATLLIRAQRGLSAALFALACTLTAGWLGTAAVQFWRYGELRAAAFALEAASGLAWLIFVGCLLWSVANAFVRPRRMILASAATLLVGASIAVVLAYISEVSGVSDKVFIAFRLLTIITSAIVLENLIRNTAAGEWWSLKLLCIGLGGVLAYDLFLYADGLLFSALSRPLIAARGVIYALVVPLLFVVTIRRGMWHAQLHVSHRTAFYSSAIAAIGSYLAVMALAAYYITRMGGTWGPIVQAIFLFGALITLLLIMFSGSSRAFLRVTIAKHLYKYKYDYREEWLRFTRRLGETESGAPIALRITEAVADIVDSTGGALWLRDGERYALASTLYTAASSLGAQEVEPLARILSEKGWIIDLDEWQQNPDRYDGLQLPQALRSIQHGWIIVPLAHRGQLLAFVLLLRPRTHRSLDWEDFDFLKLIGLHAGSFLAEHRAMQALAQAQEFERFNRRTAFVIHDIKNIVSELSLFASNIRKHGDNPRFLKDLTEAIEGAVGRSKRLIERLHDDQDRIAVASNRPLSLKPLMAALMQGFPEGSVAFQVENGSEDLAVAGDEDRLRALFGHMLRNALDATGGRGGVTLSLGASGARAIVEVSDNGPGMAADFVLNQLFKPFHSTKSGGLGIGAYQCREHARELGGDIEVITSPGSGTTMRIFLPLARAPDLERPAQSG